MFAGEEQIIFSIFLQSSFKICIPNFVKKRVKASISLICSYKDICMLHVCFLMYFYKFRNNDIVVFLFVFFSYNLDVHLLKKRVINDLFKIRAGYGHNSINREHLGFNFSFLLYLSITRFALGPVGFLLQIDRNRNVLEIIEIAI